MNFGGGGSVLSCELLLSQKTTFGTKIFFELLRFPNKGPGPKRTRPLETFQNDFVRDPVVGSKSDPELFLLFWLFFQSLL